MTLPGMLLGSHNPLVRTSPLDEALHKLKSPFGSTLELNLEDHHFDSYDSFRAKYNIGYEPSPDFQFRAPQAAVADIFLSESVDLLCLGPTASGKTVVAWFVALAAINEGKRVIFTSPTHDLNKQPFIKLPDKLGLPDHLFGVIPQGCAAKNAEAIIDDPRKRVISMTPQAALKYKDKLFAEGEGVLICDEMQRFVGNSPGAILINSLPEKVRVLFLTATETKSITEMRVTSDRIRRMRTVELSAEGRLKLYSRIPLQLDSELQELADHIGEMIDFYALKLCNHCKEFPELVESISQTFRGTKDFTALFEKPGTVGQVLDLGKRIDKKKNSKVINFEASMDFYKCNQLYEYYQALTLFGKGELIASLIRAYRKGLREIEKKSVERECDARSIRNVAIELSKNTSFRSLCDLATRGTDLSGFLDCTKSQLPSEKAIRDELISYPGFLHPKERYIIQELKRRPQEVLDKGVLIYCSRKCTSMILPERIMRFFNDITADYLVGSGHTKDERAQRSEALSKFNSREVNVLVGTDTLLYGVDTESELLFTYDVPRSSSDNEQVSGRSGRRENIGEVVFLMTVGSVDETRLYASARTQAAKRKRRENH